MHQLLRNYVRHMDVETNFLRQAYCDSRSHHYGDQLAKHVTKIIIEKHAHLLFPEGKIMEGPVQLFSSKNNKTVTAEARTVRLMTQYYPSPCGFGLEDIIEQIIDEHYMIVAESIGFVVCPYILLIPTGMVDPTSGEAYFEFRTRFGIIER